MTSNLLTRFTADAVMNGAATLIGAFLGAMLAFLFQLTFQRKQEHKVALMSAHRMLFCLLQQMNTIQLVQRDFIFPRLDDSGRYLSIPAIYEIDLEKNVFDFSTFSFMLETKESRIIMYDLFHAKESHIQAFRILNERSRLHRTQVQSLYISSGIKNGSPVTHGEIKSALGPHLYQSIVAITDQVIDELKSAYKKLDKSKTEFRAYVVKRFKTNDFTDFDFPDTYGLLPEKE